MEWLTNLYPVTIGTIAVSIVAVLYGADFVTSAVAAFGISKRFARVEDMLEDLTAYLQTTKLYETKEEIRDKLGRRSERSIWPCCGKSHQEIRVLPTA